uniref:Uncharacterized protein LOC111112020 n=1 Tax=Crassostrea virginica TaxID=6565 RepID=A0A8B8BNT8_CRAVI|nr:uncharacterized protein LOC111112020 [Crassostrea virginica]
MRSQLMRFLWCIAFIMMAGIPVRGHPIADQTSNNTEDNGYYNIYSKIDSLEKNLQNLQTGVKNKNKLLQQIFLAIAELDADPAMTDVDLKSLVLQTKSKNDTAIGFTTRLSSTTYSSTSSIIRGDTLLYNGGNAYNGTVFTSKSPGLYLFHVSLLTDTVSNGIWIYKNSERLTLAWTGNINSQFNGASASAAVFLDVGDQLCLRPNGSRLKVDGNSVFTGVKVN